MSDLSDLSRADLPQVGGSVASTSAGAMMRQAREAIGLHIAALAVSLKVPVKRLEALEADRWELLPDAVFIRALASSVCRALKIDPMPVLEQLPKAPASGNLPADGGINTPLQTPGFTGGTPFFHQLSKPVVLAVLALLAGALVMIFYPSREQQGPVAAKPQEQARAPLPGAPTSEMPSLIASDTLAPALPQASAAIAAMPSNANNEAMMVLQSRGDSWVEVVDAHGATRLRRVIQAGERVEVSGALPLSVVVGRADVIDVQLRGKPFNLEAVAKANVARFEVKE